MTIFVISLKNEIDRRTKINSQLNNLHLKYDFFDAILGKDFYNDSKYFDKRKALKAEGRELSTGEVGCALSHNQIYKKIVELDIPYALILEDDACISNDLPIVLKELENIIVQGQIITLERCDFFKKNSRKNIILNYSIVTPKYVKEGGIAQTAGYIITLNAAKKITNINFPVFFPADSWGYYMKHVEFKGIIPSQTLVSQSNIFFSSTQNTQIHRQFNKKSELSLLIHGFKTYTIFGRLLYKIYKKTMRKK